MRKVSDLSGRYPQTLAAPFDSRQLASSEQLAISGGILTIIAAIATLMGVNYLNLKSKGSVLSPFVNFFNKLLDNEVVQDFIAILTNTLAYLVLIITQLATYTILSDN